jgi:aldehyde:ferredoxin oxidoreductase
MMLVDNSDDHVGDPAIASRVFSAVTGRDVDEEGFCEIGEKVFNLQRAILTREGHGGRKSDNLPDIFYSQPLQADHFNPGCLAPGKDGEPISRQGQVVDRSEFERMKDEYYGLRGWDVASGLQRRSQLEALGLGYIADELAKDRLIV